jgi:hypothetical protein
MDPKDLLVNNARATRLKHVCVDYSATTPGADGGTIVDGYRVRTLLNDGSLWAVLIRKHTELSTDNRYLIRQVLPNGLPEVWYWNSSFGNSTGLVWPSGVLTRLHGTAMLLYDLVLPGYTNLDAEELPGTTPIQGPGTQPPVLSRMVQVTVPPGAPLDQFRIWVHQGYWYDHRVEESLAGNVHRVVYSASWAPVSVDGALCWHPERRDYHDSQAGLHTTLETVALTTNEFPQEWFDKEFLGQSW